MTSYNNQFLGHGIRNVVRVSHCSCHQHPVPILREVFTISELSDNSYCTTCLLQKQVFILAPAGPLRSLNVHQQPATTRHVVDTCVCVCVCVRARAHTHTHTLLASRLRMSEADLPSPPRAFTECTTTTLHSCKRCRAFTDIIQDCYRVILSLLRLLTSD